MTLTGLTNDTSTLWRPADLEAIRARYRAEREKRLRPEGLTQYVSTDHGEFSSVSADPWTERAERDPVHDDVDVTIVGAGFSGLVAASYLRKAGVQRIRHVEVAGDVGGTWYWNRYPGLACDIESYIYLPLLEEVGVMPSRKYPRGDEILRHARAVAERFDLYRDSLFHTRVTSVAWDEERSHHTVTTDRGDEFASRYVILSSGPFNRPKLPGVTGIADFRGHMFHTSRWDYEYTGGSIDGGLVGLAGKRVAIVGTGATAIQVVPNVAEDAGHLFVVQRTPSGVDARDDAPTDEQWWNSLEPGWQRTRRENFLALVQGSGAPENLVGDKWTDTAPVRGSDRVQRSAGREDPMLSVELADHEKMEEIRARVADIVADPDTVAALQPWYRQMCKRPTFSDRYLQAFNRDNVELIDTDGQGIERFTESGFVVGGVEYEVDTVIFATGFDLGSDPSTRAGSDLRGRGGKQLSEYWASGLRTLHGWVSHGFPNLFNIGLSQNAYSVNLTHILEEQGAHIGAVVAEAERRGGVVIEPSEEAEEAWVQVIRANPMIDAQFAFMSECTPGFYNDEGQAPKVSVYYPGGPIAFHALLKEWRESGGMDEVFTPIDSGAPGAREAQDE